MSYYTQNSLFPVPNIPVQNGYASQMNEKQKISVNFLDVTPARTPYIKPSSPNAVVPLENTLINPIINRDIIYENIKPVFTILRVMGVLPLTRTSPGNNEFQLVSPPMVYSVIVYFSLVAYIMYLSLIKGQIMRTSEGKFEEAVIEYLFTIYLFPMLAVPILWYETGKIAGVLNEWVKFETAYRQLSGQVLTIKLYRQALAISIIIPTLSTTSVIITHITMRHFEPMQLIPYVFLEILTYILGGYWYLICEALSVCANILAEDFHRLMATMVTYLVVLLQFQISIPSEGQNSDEEDTVSNVTVGFTDPITTTTTAITTILTTVAKKRRKH
ncbi:unnamed protein product [Diatraea saccharalis]|uniref:Gustatory receptor n=1 Tax=Diatraea saccharalis TaxID=40085 RepID=A0A9N9RB97_9NEOP|nr:unnamed protein product [Diatraea saccharalis]